MLIKELKELICRSAVQVNRTNEGLGVKEKGGRSSTWMVRI